MLDLFDNVWGNKDEVILEHAADVTLQVQDFSSLLVPLFTVSPFFSFTQIALLIIGSAGMTYDISKQHDLRCWSQDLVGKFLGRMIRKYRQVTQCPSKTLYIMSLLWGSSRCSFHLGLWAYIRQAAEPLVRSKILRCVYALHFEWRCFNLIMHSSYI